MITRQLMFLVAAFLVGHLMVVSAFTTCSIQQQLSFMRPNQLQSHADDFSKKSIGELTQNLHGGKYQFSDTQYLSGNSIIGQQFAESLYSSSSASGSCVDNSDEDFIVNEEKPKWAMRLQQPNEHKGRQLTGTLTFTSSNNMHTITIKNEERSWEQFYAYILGSSNSIATASEDLFQLSSVRGHLAPRGGASNACDASKPYSDSADIRIEFVGDPQAAATTFVTDEELLLVVGTEAEVWRWQLNFA